MAHYTANAECVDGSNEHEIEPDETDSLVKYRCVEENCSLKVYKDLDE
jgi:hypothetical protein